MTLLEQGAKGMRGKWRDARRSTFLEQNINCMTTKLQGQDGRDTSTKWIGRQISEQGRANGDTEPGKTF